MLRIHLVYSLKRIPTFLEGQRERLRERLLSAFRAVILLANRRSAVACVAFLPRVFGHWASISAFGKTMVVLRKRLRDMRFASDRDNALCLFAPCM